MSLKSAHSKSAITSKSKPLLPPPEQKKTTRHFVETYHSEDVISKVLEEHKDSILHYAYIFHDKDKKEDGSPKEPHWHVLLRLKSSRTLTCVQGWFDSHVEETANTRNPEACASIGLSYAYLTHKHHPSKSQYEPWLIRTDARAWFECALYVAERDMYFPKEVDNGYVQMYLDILSGLTVRDMVNKWGKSYIFVSDKLNKLVAETRREESLIGGIQFLEKRFAQLNSVCDALESQETELRGQVALLADIKDFYEVKNDSFCSCSFRHYH